MVILAQTKGLSSPVSCFLTVANAFATIIPRVSQVDNSSNFLGNVPHRRHPGVLHLRSVRLPAELVKAAQLLVEQSTVHGLKDQVVALTNYLWSRKRPLEANELQRRRQQLEQQLREKVQSCTAGDPQLTCCMCSFHLRYTDELSLVYMAARLDGGFAAVSRAFHEIQKRVPDFAPRTLLDFGSGTGSVSWAAHGAWGQTLREYLCVDSSAPMLALAERLLQGEFLPVSPKVKGPACRDGREWGMKGQLGLEGSAVGAPVLCREAWEWGHQCC
uniref:Methyltransferase like 17 n=1 Tax=Chelonoidis abingdonii TaxID=106734 RepID=A0A8C0G6W7_CHEAB